MFAQCLLSCLQSQNHIWPKDGIFLQGSVWTQGVKLWALREWLPVSHAKNNELFWYFSLVFQLTFLFPLLPFSLIAFHLPPVHHTPPMLLTHGNNLCIFLWFSYAHAVKHTFMHTHMYASIHAHIIHYFAEMISHSIDFRIKGIKRRKQCLQKVGSAMVSGYYWRSSLELTALAPSIIVLFKHPTLGIKFLSN